MTRLALLLSPPNSLAMDEASAIQLLSQQALPELLVPTPFEQQVEVLQQPDNGTPPGEANADTEPSTPTTTTTAETVPSDSAGEQSRPDTESASISDMCSGSITSTLTNVTSISTTSITATTTTTTIECIITPVISTDVETVPTEPPKKRRRTKRDATSHPIPASTRELRSRARPKVEAQNRDSIEAVGSDDAKSSPMDMPKSAASFKGKKRARSDSAPKAAMKRPLRATKGVPMYMYAADTDPEDI
ncbi:MAG: hypothetical protein J3Q66DRAFT_423298 [Benniella sp.]|nr:MAG: hypothetical protein J3Q66DRAFT_423298 [Benniella sp.]